MNLVASSIVKILLLSVDFVILSSFQVKVCEIYEEM